MKFESKKWLGLSAIFAVLVGCTGQSKSVASRGEFTPFGSELSGGKVQPVQYTAPAAGPIDFRAAAKRVLPSVVSIDQYVEGRDFWGESTGRIMKGGTGSGVVLSSDGYIITNNHVVNNSRAINVRTQDHQTFQAKLIGADPTSDLALLKVDAKNLIPIEMGDSSKVEIGQWVLAIGNPLGYDGTVSAGVVSSLDRSLRDSEESYLVGAIQTDAPINPGNSGGALVDTNGKLIGINTAIASETGGSVGIGFAIPVNRVRRVAEEIRQYGYAKLVGLGIVPQAVLSNGQAIPVENLHPSLPRVNYYLRQQTGAEPPKEGVVVFGVDPKSSAARAGLSELDVITKLDGQDIRSYIDVRRVLADRKAGEKVEVTFWHKGKSKSATIELMELTPAVSR